MSNNKKVLLGLEPEYECYKKSEVPRTITDADGNVLDFDVVFSKKSDLFEFLAREIPSRPDTCLSLHGTASANAKLVRAIFGQIFPASKQCSLSCLAVNKDSLQVADLFGVGAGKDGGVSTSTVTGIKVSSASQAVETILRFAPSSMQADSTVVLTASRTGADNTKQRMHLTFGGAGVWGPALTLSSDHLLSKLAARCTCFRVASAAQSEFASEWYRIFPKSESRLLAEAQRRISHLEEQLAEAQRRLALRENTLVNVLISTHPAFKGLDDYPRRRKPMQDKENGENRNVEWDSSVKDKSAPLSRSTSAVKAKKPQQMLRTLSNGTSGGAARVARTPGQTPSRTAGRTPGVVKSKSRVF